MGNHNYCFGDFVWLHNPVSKGSPRKLHSLGWAHTESIRSCQKLTMRFNTLVIIHGKLYTSIDWNNVRKIYESIVTKIHAWYHGLLFQTLDIPLGRPSNWWMMTMLTTIFRDHLVTKSTIDFGERTVQFASRTNRPKQLTISCSYSSSPRSTHLLTSQPNMRHILEEEGSNVIKSEVEHLL